MVVIERRVAPRDEDKTARRRFWGLIAVALAGTAAAWFLRGLLGCG